MYAIDLFETKSVDEGAFAHLTPGSSALATANFALLANAYRESLPEVELDFGSQPLRLNSKEINFLANYYDQLRGKELKTKFIYEVMPRYNRVYELLVKRGFRDLEVVPPDTQPQLPGLQEKKSSDSVTSPYKDVRVQRAVKKAAFDNPAAASPEEAFIKSMLDAQDKDQEDISKLRQSTEKQRELLNKNLQLDRDQQDHLSDIEKEINKVDQESDELRKLQQRMIAANAQLQQKLQVMRGKKPEAQTATASTTTPEPTVGVSVATDKEPEGYKYRQARLTAAQRAMYQRLKQLDPSRLKDPTQGQALKQLAGQLSGDGADDETLPILNKQSTPVPGEPANDPRQTSLFAAEDLTHGLEENTIPVKQVLQGYVVTFNPTTNTVAIGQRGQILKQFTLKVPTRRGYEQLVNKFIRDQEDDKYPDDSEDRDVRLPMRAKELAESLSARVYFKDGTSTRLTGIPSLEIDLKQYFAKKGKQVDRVDYDFAASSRDRDAGPEAHEPGSGRATSARTGDPLPEGDVVSINRGGHNAFRDKADFLDKRDYVQRQLLDPRQRENHAELKQRLQDINYAGRKLGYIK